MAITNNLHEWDTSGGSSTYYDSSTLTNNTTRQNGFSQNTGLDSKLFNAMWKETALVTTSFIDALAAIGTSETLTVGVGTSRSDLATAIQNILTSSTATNLAGGAAGSIPYQTGSGTTAFLAKGTTGYVLVQGNSNAPTWKAASSLSVGSAATAVSASNATTATRANNVADITPTPGVDADVIAFSIGDKSYSKKISVNVSGTIDSARTVTENIQINGLNMPISTIFENSGAAKSATTAGSATTATTATKLGSSNVGTNKRFIYLASGTPTASAQTVGSSTQPVYMNGGTFTQCSYDLKKLTHHLNLNFGLSSTYKNVLQFDWASQTTYNTGTIGAADLFSVLNSYFGTFDEGTYSIEFGSGIESYFGSVNKFFDIDGDIGEYTMYTLNAERIDGEYKLIFYLTFYDTDSTYAIHIIRFTTDISSGYTGTYKCDNLIVPRIGTSNPAVRKTLPWTIVNP